MNYRQTLISVQRWISVALFGRWSKQPHRWPVYGTGMQGRCY